MEEQVIEYTYKCAKKFSKDIWKGVETLYEVA